MTYPSQACIIRIRGLTISPIRPTPLMLGYPETQAEFAVFTFPHFALPFFPFTNHNDRQFTIPPYVPMYAICQLAISPYFLYYFLNAMFAFLLFCCSLYYLFMRLFALPPLCCFALFSLLFAYAYLLTLFCPTPFVFYPSRCL